MEIKIEQLKYFSENVVSDLNKLLLQLSPNYKEKSEDKIKEIINKSENHIFVAKDGNKIIGILTLIIVDPLFLKKGLLEEMVVDRNYRGKGIGTKLITTVLNQARNEGLAYVDFTSRQERLEANNLYQRLGFKKRNTNVYRIEL
jgi:ribosomal protein S18 acetylase RimI-like enzyme